MNYSHQISFQAFGHFRNTCGEQRKENGLPLIQIPPGSHIMRPFPVGVAIDLTKGVIIHD